MKIFFWIVGVVAVLAIAVIAAVPIIANTAFVKDRIATAARDATGRDLVIAGDIELSLFPPVHVVVGDVRLANAPGAAADNMVTIGALDMSIDALALIDGAVIIESMTISDPKIWLEANVAGRPNWDIGGAQAPTGSAAGGQGSAASPKSVAPPEIRVGSIRIEGGAMSFRDAAGNEAVRAENISIDLAAPAPENPLTLAGTMAVNGQAVTVEVLVDAFGRALAGERFTLNASLVSPLISAGYEGAVQQAPVPGLDGSMTLDIGSVGDLAAWLGQPLPEGQPDPGPLKLTATLAAEGSAVTLTEAMIEGDSLNATATGSFELDGDLTKIVFALEGDQLDIDRYLPPPPPAPVASESEPTSEPEPTADESTPIAPKDLFAMIPDDPLDLTALQSTEADITIRLGGLSAVGYEVGPIDVKLDVIDGALSVLIDEIGLYGGAVTGFLTMTPSDNGVVVDSSISIDQIAVAELAMAAAIDMPVVGIASGTLAVRSEGASARGLAKSAAGKLDFSLGGVETQDATLAAVSEVTLSLELPGFEAAPSLTASVVYNGERVDLTLDTDPLPIILGEDRFAVNLSVASKLISVTYEGAIQQRPVQGLDGVFDLDVGSVGALAAWLGQPLPDGQPDPGPLAIHAALAADGPKVVLSEATIAGEDLNATASGSLDASGDVKIIDFVLDAESLDIDRYLPPPAEPIAATEDATDATDASPTEVAEAAGDIDILAGLPTKPFDMAHMRGIQGKVAVRIGQVRAMGYEVGPIDLAMTMDGGVHRLVLGELGLYGGDISGSLTMDGSQDGLGVDAAFAIADVAVARLAEVAGAELPVTGVATGTVAAKGWGENPRALVAALTAEIDFVLAGVESGEAAMAGLSELTLMASLPGFDAAPTLDATAVYKGERVAVGLALDPLPKVLGGDRFDVEVSVTSTLVTAGYKGAVQQHPVPGLDGIFDLDIGSVGALAAWLDQPLPAGQPDPGPLKVHAALSADGPKVVLSEATIVGDGLNAEASGSLDVSGDVKIIDFTLKADSLDIDKYLPPPVEAVATEEELAEDTAEESKVATDIGEDIAEDIAEDNGDPLAALSTEPFDLAPLRAVDGKIAVQVGQVRAMGYEVEPIDLAVTMDGGTHRLDLAELGLYGGGINGSLTVDGSGDDLGVDAAFTIANLALGRLAEIAGVELPMTGIATGTIAAKGRGESARALVAGLTANVDMALAAIEAADETLAGLSDLSVKASLPGIDSGPALNAIAVYKGERVEVGLTLDPLPKVLAGDRFDIEFSLASALVNAGYKGAVQQKPVPGLDGDLYADIGSVGALAAWLGQPFPDDQRDPGSLELQAHLAADGEKVALESAVIEGAAFKASATGSYDGSGDIPIVQAALTIDQLDLNAYLPEPPPATEAASESAPATAGQPAPIAEPGDWSDEPIDASALGSAIADIRVAAANGLYRDLTIDALDAEVTLSGGLLTAVINELRLVGGTIVGRASVDGSGDSLGLNYDLTADGLQAKPLLATFADFDQLSGTMQFAARGQAQGATEHQIVSSLNGDGMVSFTDGAIEGIDLAGTLRRVGDLDFGNEPPEAQNTDFSELGGTFVIVDGVIDNRDFKMLAPLLRVEGAGLVPMPPRMIDYQVTAKLVASLVGQGGNDVLAGIPIPVGITGPWHDPGYDVDVQGVFAE